MMGLEFEHRASDSPLVERVWQSRSGGTLTMTSVARAHWDLVFWMGPDGHHAGVQGPESRASRAQVPLDSEFLGIRFALGTVLTGLPVPSLVDRFVGLPTDGRSFQLGGQRVRSPRHDEVEDLVRSLVRAGLLASIAGHTGSVTDRTRQRRYLAAVGLPQRTVSQIGRARDAAVRLRAGRPPAVVAQECGYFDQPHLARSLRRFVGRSATELAAEAPDSSPLSLLYKTDSTQEA